MQMWLTLTSFCGVAIKETLKDFFIAHVSIIIIFLQINQISANFIK
jgi:hypothetical protein